MGSGGHGVDVVEAITHFGLTPACLFSRFSVNICYQVFYRVTMVTIEKVKFLLFYKEPF